MTVPDANPFLEHIGPTTVIQLFELKIHPEDDHYIVGRIETGIFVALPEEGVRVISLMYQSLCMQAIEQQLTSEGLNLDIPAFLADLFAVGFVARVDDFVVKSPDDVRITTTWNWIKPEYVTWLFEKKVLTLWCLTVLAALITLFLQPQTVIPSYDDFFWSRSLTVIFIGNTCLYWLNVFFHELFHLIAARSFNLPVQLEISTRLNNLVIQTRVNGLWSETRSKRHRVYLAGMAWDGCILAILILVKAWLPLPPLVHNIVSSMILLIFLLSVIFQIHLYMKTDLYYVLKEYLRCPNLFDDAWRFLHYLGFRAINTVLRRVHPQSDPLSYVPERERWRIRLFAYFSFGMSLCAVSIAVYYGIPITWTMLVKMIMAVVDGIRSHNLVVLLDGLFIPLYELSALGVFLVVLVRKKRND